MVRVFQNKTTGSFYLLLMMILWRLPQVNAQSALGPYQFKETTDLVNFVSDAAALFSEKGEESFIAFGEHGSKWFTGTRYIFLYDLTGKCVFHPVNKELAGQNLINLKDMNGKPIIRFITNIASSTAHPTGWIHYLWAEKGELFPSWKHAYIMGVKGPDGKTYAIGSGTYNLRTETQWVVDDVDSAARLLEARGKEAYKDLVDKASIFYFYNTYIFVLSLNGRMVVDPAFPTNEGRDMMDFQDFAGHYIVRELLERLGNQETVYLTYMWPAPGQSNPSKKMIYARKVQCGDRSVIVGSSLYLMEPIWKKF
jgi:signal transduction histidine kinase